MKHTFQVTVDVPFSDADVADWRLQQAVASGIERTRVRRRTGERGDPFIQESVRTLKVVDIRPIETPADEADPEMEFGRVIDQIFQDARENFAEWARRKTK